ncbi:MAG: transposase [Prevotellaceae bacterium]|jgi:DNA-binding transcriptional regulator LsrR (DeoR family)|nr:transposase [Prevotellaceae bacterium]
MTKYTKKQEQYLAEVLRLHYEKGYGGKRISRITPIGHSTVSRWLSIVTPKNDRQCVKMQKQKQTSQTPPTGSELQTKDIKALEAEIASLCVALREERLRADAYDEMINVAETKFRISIR